MITFRKSVLSSYVYKLNVIQHAYVYQQVVLQFIYSTYNSYMVKTKITYEYSVKIIKRI